MIYLSLHYIPLTSTPDSESVASNLFEPKYIIAIVLNRLDSQIIVLCNFTVNFYSLKDDYIKL